MKREGINKQTNKAVKYPINRVLAELLVPISGALDFLIINWREGGTSQTLISVPRSRLDFSIEWSDSISAC